MASPSQLRIPESSPEQKQSPLRELMREFDVKDVVSIKSEIYQSEKLGGEDGSCDGVATEWLRCNVQQKPEQFRELVVKDFDHFGSVTKRIDATKAEIKGRMSRIACESDVQQGQIRAANFAKDRLFVMNMGIEEIGGDPQPEKVPKLASLALKALERSPMDARVAAEKAVDRRVEEMAPLVRQNHESALGVNEELRQVYSDLVFGADSAFSLEDAGQGNGNTLKQDLKHRLNVPGYYLVYISKPGQTGGHTIGIHISDRPRFLDANSCEIEFRQREYLDLFLDSYWDRVYQSHVGPYHVYRFSQKQNILETALSKVRSLFDW